MDTNEKDKYLKHMPANKVGKDYIVGDLHGCLEDLLLALKEIGFNENVDRLFSVGDLIDRGPDSEGCTELIGKKWFHGVRGNHEEMMIEAIINKESSYINIWAANGGMWAFTLSEPQQLKIAKRLDTLPYVITVGEGADRFNIVHAELVRSGYVTTDNDVDQWTFTEAEISNMLWGRKLATDFPHVRDYDVWKHTQDGLSLTYVGHTPTRELFTACNQMFLDRGCVYRHVSKSTSEQNVLGIACHQDRVVYEWSPLWKKITAKVEYDDIATIGNIQDRRKTAVPDHISRY